MTQPVLSGEHSASPPVSAVAGWPIRGWVVMSAAAAPILLLAGVVVAPMFRPAGYDSVRDTISSLAARDVDSRYVMTAAFIGMGLSYMVTAAGMLGAATIGRVLLAVGGMGTVLVGLFPLPYGTGGSAAHAASATIAVVGMTLWPLPLAMTRSYRPFPARMLVAASATAVLFLLFVWFGVEQWTRWGHVGLSERVAALCQSVWPLVVVVSGRSRATKVGGHVVDVR